jgi:hypothetical protein
MAALHRRHDAGRGLGAVHVRQPDPLTVRPLGDSRSDGLTATSAQVKKNKQRVIVQYSRLNWGWVA